MRKSDIVVTVVRRSDTSKTEEQVLRELALVLANQSTNLDQWDTPIETPIANAMITSISTYAGKYSMEYLVKDIDLILRRIS